MRTKRLLATVIGGALLAGTAGVPAAQAAQQSAITESGGTLYSAGQQFIPQGVNHAYQWYLGQDHAQVFSDIAATGSNTVRVVLSGGRWGTTTAQEVHDIVAQCERNELVCILDDHDTTGYGDPDAADAVRLPDTVAFWKSLAGELKGHEDTVMINLGNEPYGNALASQWTQDTIDTVRLMRDAGFEHTLVLTAPNWGQDWQHVMRDNASRVYAQDHNVLFDVHMYGVYANSDTVTSYIDAFVNQGLPLMVGEFGDNHSDGVPDAATIMRYTRQKGVGLLAWSWCGNTGGVEYLDLVNDWNGNALSSWGNLFVNGTDGLRQRGVAKAAVYTGGATAGDGSQADYPTCASADSDPDGDGWGWENGQSCIVKAAQDTQDDYPTCTSASSDPDGDGWGWEHERSCIVAGQGGQTSGSTQETQGNQGTQEPQDDYPTCTSASSDPDGDGWGWEHERSCIVRRD